MKELSTGISRRGILKSFGAGAAALATAPVLTRAESMTQAALNTAKGGLKVGIIVPNGASKANASAFLNGIDLFISNHTAIHGTAPFVPMIEESSSSSSALASTISKLSSRHTIQLAVAYTNSRITNQIASTLAEAKLPLIEANLGENVFSSNSEYCFHSSLNLWQSHYLLGKEAAAVGKTGISIGSFYDAAYDAHYAFEAGFTAAGGTIIKHIVTGSPNDHFSPIEAASVAATTDAAIVFLNYSGHDAAIFMDALNRHEVIANKAFFGGAMMNDSVVGVFDIATIQLSAATKSDFFASYKSIFGVSPNVLSVLGYETAAMIAAATSKAGKRPSGDKLASALSAVRYNGVRGPVEMNNLTHSTEAPITIAAQQLASHSIPPELTASTFRLMGEHSSGALNVYPIAA